MRAELKTGVQGFAWVVAECLNCAWVFSSGCVTASEWVGGIALRGVGPARAPSGSWEVWTMLLVSRVQN